MAIIESASTDVLLEREEALAQLHEAFAATAAGRGRFVLVGGEAGVGKTSLVRRFCEELPGGTAVFWGGCDPLVTPRPLGPFLEIAERARGAIDGVLDPWSAAHDVAAGLLELCDDRQALVVVVEDAHWADEGTLDVLRLLGRRNAATPCLALVTYRDDQLGRAHPAPHRARRSRDRGLGRAARGPTPLPRRRRTARRGRRRRRRHRLATDVGQPVLRRRAPRSRRARGSRLGPRRRAGAGRAARPTGDRRRRGGGDRATLARCGAPALRVRRGDRRRRRVHRERRSPHGRRRRRIPARALARGRGGVAVARPATRVAPLDAAGADGLASCGRRPGTHRASRRGALPTARPCFGSHPRRPSRQRGPARTARLPPSTRAPSASPATLLPATARTLLEGRSRACYLADDQTEAIEVIREAIRCRQTEGAPLEEARALTELTDYLWCRGYNGEADETVDRASQLAADRPEQREHAYVFHTQALQALYRGDVDGCFEHARRALEIGARFGDELIAGHARVTIGSATARSDLERGLRLIEEAVETARRNGEHEVAARGMNALVLRPMPWNRHDLVERAIDDAIEYCTEHTQDLWRINVQAVAARWALDRGRWDDASGHARAVIDDPRESPWTHHEALCVLALVRARRGDPGARDALAAAAAVGVPQEEEFAHVDLAAARAEVAWLERAGAEVDSGDRSGALRPRRAGRPGRRRAAPLLEAARRPRAPAYPRMDRGRMRLRSPADGGRRQTSGRGRAAPTRRRSRCRRPATSRRCEMRTPSAVASAPARWPRSWRESSVSWASATSREGRARRRGRTRPS